MCEMLDWMEDEKGYQERERSFGYNDAGSAPKAARRAANQVFWSIKLESGRERSDNAPDKD
jgi:hypothetical protein